MTKRSVKSTPDHPDNRAEDGFPLGLTKPVQELTPAEMEAVAKRHNIWTRPKMARFLDALASTASVSAAAQSVGMSRQSAYRLRSRLSNQAFDIAWEAALEFGLQQLAHAALERALHGVDEPIFYEGRQVGTRKRFDEKLTAFLLANPAAVGRRAVQRELLLENWQRVLDHVEKAPASDEAALRELEKLRQDPDQAEDLAASEALLDEKIKSFYRERSHHLTGEEAKARPRGKTPGK